MRGLFAALFLVISLAASAAVAESYSDPVPYCAAVGTIDKPDQRYTGPKLPAWMAAKLNLAPDQGKFMEWRCAEGTVLACLYGANIPCDSKAETSQVPTPGIADYCRQNPGSDFVPMYVTGHDTVISWACHGTDPVVTDVGAVDGEGYAKAFWEKVAP